MGEKHGENSRILKLKIKIFIYIAAFIIIGLISSFLYISYILDKDVYTNTDANNKNDIIFEIPKGSSINKIVKTIKENKLINKNFDIDLTSFKLVAKWLKLDNKLRYGKFSIDKNVKNLSYKSFIILLTKGGTLTKNVTIPEGSRLIQIAHILKKEMNIDSLKFMSLTKDKEFINLQLGLKEYNLKTLEGFLYPETYNFNENENLENIVKKFVKRFKIEIKKVENDIKSSKYSLVEIITLASIVQGEVMVDSEAEFVSSVYNNRLIKNMLLQADPTIQYLFNTPKRLYHKDLESNSRYNTYKFKGLPPTPINNPSLHVIKATLNPAKTKYIFMVAKGNGEHYFNETWNGHLRDKAKFDEIRKKLKK